jgi:hypothetical protein
MTVALQALCQDPRGVVGYVSSRRSRNLSHRGRHLI